MNFLQLYLLLEGERALVRMESKVDHACFYECCETGYCNRWLADDWKLHLELSEFDHVIWGGETLRS
jgi:hypothetical protein